MSIGITDGPTIWLCPFGRRGRDGYHPVVFDAQEEGGVGKAAGRGIEELLGSFGPPLLGSFSRGRRDGYPPTVSGVEKGRVKEDET